MTRSFLDQPKNNHGGPVPGVNLPVACLLIYFNYDLPVHRDFPRGSQTIIFLAYSCRIDRVQLRQKCYYFGDAK
jgi:hypothetical protein